MKKILTILIITSLTLSITSCDKYLDVNNNVDAPDYVEDYIYLAGIIQSYQSTYWDIRALAPLSQMMGSGSGYFSLFAAHNFPQSRDDGGEVWRMNYWLQGQNLENLINQAEAAEHWTLAGIGYAIKAYSWDMLTKIHGDVPMDDAYVPGLLSHNYNTQEEVFTQVREWAYKAIEYLEMDDSYNYGSTISDNDFIYGGDKSKWIKFAYGTIVRNLSALTNKNDFTAKYADELIECASKAMQTTAEDATVSVPGGGADAQFSAYNNFWGVRRSNMSRIYWQHDYPVRILTGTLVKYNEANGDLIQIAENTEDIYSYYRYELLDKQIVTDTIRSKIGHYDPRLAAKLATEDDPNYENINDRESVMARRYYGSGFSSRGEAPNMYGRGYVIPNATIDGSGRWLFRDDAPYILMTAAEIKFCLAEAHWKKGDKAAAYSAFKEGVALDMDFTHKHLSPGTEGKAEGGDKITKDLFNELANEYLAGPYVENLPMTDFSLSHIMMQKYVALWPWGASEAWVDQRKYHYDMQYTGEYPTNGNGYDDGSVYNKWDTDPTKVFKGFYLAPAEVEGRKGSYDLTENMGSPCYRIRPRYNSEYMWNIPSLDKLTPIAGTAVNYHCSIPWFAYPGEVPQSL